MGGFGGGGGSGGSGGGGGGAAGSFLAAALIKKEKVQSTGALPAHIRAQCLYMATPGVRIGTKVRYQMLRSVYGMSQMEEDMPKHSDDEIFDFTQFPTSDSSAAAAAAALAAAGPSSEVNTTHSTASSSGGWHTAVQSTFRSLLEKHVSQPLKSVMDVTVQAQAAKLVESALAGSANGQTRVRCLSRAAMTAELSMENPTLTGRIEAGSVLVADGIANDPHTDACRLHMPEGNWTSIVSKSGIVLFEPEVVPSFVQSLGINRALSSVNDAIGSATSYLGEIAMDGTKEDDEELHFPGEEGASSSGSSSPTQRNEWATVLTPGHKSIVRVPAMQILHVNLASLKPGSPPGENVVTLKKCGDPDAAPVAICACDISFGTEVLDYRLRNEAVEFCCHGESNVHLQGYVIAASPHDIPSGGGLDPHARVVLNNSVLKIVADSLAGLRTKYKNQQSFLAQAKNQTRDLIQTNGHLQVSLDNLAAELRNAALHKAAADEKNTSADALILVQAERIETLIAEVKQVTEEGERLGSDNQMMKTKASASDTTISDQEKMITDLREKVRLLPVFEAAAATASPAVADLGSSGNSGGNSSGGLVSMLEVATEATTAEATLKFVAASSNRNANLLCISKAMSTEDLSLVAPKMAGVIQKGETVVAQQSTMEESSGNARLQVATSLPSSLCGCALASLPTAHSCSLSPLLGPFLDLSLPLCSWMTAGG